MDNNDLDPDSRQVIMTLIRRIEKLEARLPETKEQQKSSSQAAPTCRRDDEEEARREEEAQLEAHRAAVQKARELVHVCSLKERDQFEKDIRDIVGMTTAGIEVGLAAFDKLNAEHKEQRENPDLNPDYPETEQFTVSTELLNFFIRIPYGRYEHVHKFI